MRAEARRRAALIIARIRAGEDLAPEAKTPEAVTVAALAERYLREHVAVHCKPATATQYRLAIERYIVPTLGTLAVSALGRTQVADLQHALSDRPAMANLVIATLSRMIDQAIAWGVAGEMANPCRSAPKYRTRRRERFLTDAEFRRLGSTLDELEATGRLSPHAAAALRLLMLTGCRRNEILTLRWEDVRLEAQELRLRDSKTGPRTVSLSPEAAQVLASTSAPARQPLGDPRREAGRPAVEPVRTLAPGARPRRPGRRAHPRPAPLVRKSRALALGESLPVIAKLLGHAQIQTTARYTHLTRDAVKDAATRVAEGIGGDILPTGRPSRLRASVPPSGSAIPHRGRVAGGASEDLGAFATWLTIKLKASAARVAADIGADILPPWTRNVGLESTGPAAGVAA